MKKLNRLNNSNTLFQWRVLLLIVIIHFCFSCKTKASKIDSVASYYQYVHQAEHFAINKNYVSALENYDIAFQYNSPLAIDIYNCLVCALKEKRNSKAEWCCYRLIQKGASFAFFEQALFSDFNKTTEYIKIKDSFDAWHRNYQNTINEKVRNQVIELVAIDQSVHCLLPSAKNDKDFVNRMHYNDDSLASVLSDLLQKHDYLSEDIIGAYFNTDTTLSQRTLYGLIALHQGQRGGDLLTELLMQAIKHGKLRPEVGLDWLSQNKQLKLKLARKYKICNDTLWKERDTDMQKMFDEMMIGPSDSSLLSEYYLSDEAFRIEERIIYNFYRECRTCKDRSNRDLIIFPSAPKLESKKSLEEAFGIPFTDMYSAVAVP